MAAIDAAAGWFALAKLDRPAIGALSVIASLAVVLMGLTASDRPGAFMSVAAFISGPVGAAIAHGASGMIMGRERASVSALTGFD